MFRTALAFLTTLVFLLPVPFVSAQQPDSTSAISADSTATDYDITILPDTLRSSSRPKVGLVLSGGGAKGLAHIGVLKVIEEADLDIDVVSGTSMGSIIGGLYAIGYTAEEIDSLVLHMDWEDFFSDVVSREHLSMEQKLFDARYLGSLPLRDGSVSLPNGLIPGQNFSMLLNRLTLFVHDTPNFRDLPRPFVCVATDLVTGKAVVLDHGQLSEAIRASMAIPSIFTPVPYQGSLLVDGGLVRNFPVQDAIGLGADYIIGVNVGMPLPNKDKLTDILSIVNQSLSFIGAESDSVQKTMVDLLIEPEVADYSITDFMDARQIIKAGEDAARQQLPHLKALADSLNALGEAPPHPLPPRIDSLFVEVIEIRGLNHVTKRQVMADLALDVPRWTTTSQLEAAIDRVFSSQFFERVGYRLTSTQHGTILTLHVLEKQADFFRFGFRYDSFKKASVLLNLTANNLIWNSTMATLDLVLGEYTEMEASYFFHTGYRPRIGLRLNSTYNQGEFTLHNVGSVGEVEMKYQASRSEALFGTIFSTSSVVGAGIRYNWALTKPRFSVPGVKRREVAYPSAFALFWGDTFDRANFAHEGVSMLVEFELADSSIAGTQSYRRAEIRLENRTRSSDWLTLIGKLHFGTTSNQTPLARLFMNQPFQDQVAAKPGEYAGQAMQYIGYGFQIEPWHKRFIVIEGDLGNTFADWNSNIALDQYDWGIGASVGALTVVGPISATVASGSMHDILFVLNVGFHF